jgi:hypothetical protein
MIVQGLEWAGVVIPLSRIRGASTAIHSAKQAKSARCSLRQVFYVNNRETVKYCAGALDCCADDSTTKV